MIIAGRRSIESRPMPYLLFLMLIFATPLVANERERLAASWADSLKDETLSAPSRITLLKRLAKPEYQKFAPQLLEDLRHSDKDVRVAVFRTLAKMQNPDVGNDLIRRLKSQSASRSDKAWAARALATSGEKTATVKAIVGHLGSESGQVRLAMVETLTRLTGASHSDEPAHWQEWLDKHAGLDASSWSTLNLNAETPKDRAVAARALGMSGDSVAVASLIKSLKIEEFSGVRDAIFKALVKLTGRRISYQPYKGELSDADFNKQHLAAIAAFESDKPQPADAKDTASALRELKDDSIENIETAMAALLDSRSAVRKTGLDALRRLIGFVWIFDVTADEETRTEQLELWNNWWGGYKDEPAEARAWSVFTYSFNDADLTTGMKQRKAQALRRLVNLGGASIGELALIEYEGLLGQLERNIKDDKAQPAKYSTNIELQFMYLLGRSKPKGATRVLLDRLTLKTDGKLSLQVNDAQIRSAAAWAVGQVASLPTARTRKVLLDCLVPQGRNKLLVRAAAADALGRLKDRQVLTELLAVMAGDEASSVRANAAWAVGELELDSILAGNTRQAALLNALEDGSSVVRRESLFALERITGQTFIFSWAGIQPTDFRLREQQLKKIAGQIK